MMQCCNKALRWMNGGGLCTVKAWLGNNMVWWITFQYVGVVGRAWGADKTPMIISECICTHLSSCAHQGQATPTQPDTTPAHVAHLSQHRLVPLLYDHATAVAQWMPTPAVHPLVCFGKQVTGVTLTNEGVTLQVVGSGGEMAETTTTVQAQYVVAADGANSCIRCVVCGIRGVVCGSKVVLLLRGVAPVA